MQSMKRHLFSLFKNETLRKLKKECIIMLSLVEKIIYGYIYKGRKLWLDQVTSFTTVTNLTLLNACSRLFIVHVNIG